VGVRACACACFSVDNESEVSIESIKWLVRGERRDFDKGGEDAYVQSPRHGKRRQLSLASS
jgi:hypothetical protein